jgi:hypothetical protein
VQAVIAVPNPTWINYLPSPIRDDLPHTETFVFERSCKFVVIRVHDRNRRYYPAPLLHRLRFWFDNRWGFVR